MTWKKDSASATVSSDQKDPNNCFEGNPRYTFENTSKPKSSGAGTKVIVELAVTGSDSSREITNWSRSTTDSNGVVCRDPESGVFASSSLAQSVEVTVYADGDCKWNHVWFYGVPKVKVAGCFYDRKTGSRISDSLSSATYPDVIVGRSDLQQKSIPTNTTGCFETADFVPNNLPYFVRPNSSPIPSGYKAPAFVSNLGAFVHWRPDPQSAPIGYIPATWTSYESQVPGMSDCGENCNFAYEPNSNPTGVPDCKLLSGPSTVTPSQKVTYQVTADNSNAPVTNIELSAHGTTCNDQVRPYSPQTVIGNQMTYSFDWTAPTKPGVYTLYGRVWNSNIAECRSACVDGPPRTLCAGAEQCKMQVTVGTPAPVKPTPVCDASGTTATFSWPEVPGAQRYVLRIDKVNTCKNDTGETIPWFCGPSNVAPPNANAFGEDQYVIYQAATVCNNGTCSADRTIVANDDYLNASIQWVPSASGTIAADANYIDYSTSFSCPDPGHQIVTITGTIREGMTPKYGSYNYCADTSKPPIAVPGTVSLSGAPPNTYNLGGSSSTYSFTIPADSARAERTLSLSNLTTTLCACEDFGCNYSIPTDTPGTYNYDFFVAKYTDQSWWQASGGNIYAGGGMASVIPATCKTPGCNPFLVLLERYPYTVAQRHPLSAGIPITPSTLETGSADITERPAPNTSAKLADVPVMSPKENYDYFAQKVALETIPDQTGTTITELSQLGTTSRDGVEIAKFSGNLLLAPAATWIIPGGAAASAKKYILFADSATIADEHDLKKLITVEEGGYFMLITKGAITIADSVGDLPTQKTVNVEGVYVASGNLTIEGDGDPTTQDLQFTGAGTFVGWSNIHMYRQYKDNAAGSLLNNTVPSEFFIFRPDFVRSAPGILKDSQTVWKEIK